MDMGHHCHVGQKQHLHVLRQEFVQEVMQGYSLAQPKNLACDA